eukprot:gene10083-11159_t
MRDNIGITQTNEHAGNQFHNAFKTGIIGNRLNQGKADPHKNLMTDPRLDINQVDKNETTPLQFGDDVELIKLLLSNSPVDTNMGDKDGVSPLALACGRKQDEVTRLLMGDPRVNFDSTTQAICFRAWAERWVMMD